MGKVTLDDTMMSAIVKMAAGNPGAVTVLTELIKKVPQIDITDGFLYVLFLDDLGLYGPGIWMLYKDVCGQEIAGVVTLLRARQLGHLSSGQLRRIIDEDKPYDWMSLVPLVQGDVPEFKV